MNEVTDAGSMKFYSYPLRTHIIQEKARRAIKINNKCTPPICSMLLNTRSTDSYFLFRAMCPWLPSLEMLFTQIFIQ